MRGIANTRTALHDLNWVTHVCYRRLRNSRPGRVYNYKGDRMEEKVTLKEVLAILMMFGITVMGVLLFVWGMTR